MGSQPATVVGHTHIKVSALLKIEDFNQDL